MINAGAGIWVGRAFEEVRDRAGPHVVARNSSPSLPLPVSQIFRLFPHCFILIY